MKKKLLTICIICGTCAFAQETVCIDSPVINIDINNIFYPFSYDLGMYNYIYYINETPPPPIVYHYWNRIEPYRHYPVTGWRRYYSNSFPRYHYGPVQQYKKYPPVPIHNRYYNNNRHYSPRRHGSVPRGRRR